MEVSTNITCPKCKSVGVVVWEMAAPQRVLVSLTKNFYERLSKKDPFPTELVCNQCEAVAKRPGGDEDKGPFEAKVKKIAATKPSLPSQENKKAWGKRGFKSKP